MKIGLREKIFACGLIAISLVFLLYDGLYLNPKMTDGILEIQTELKTENSTYTEISAGAAEAKLINDYDESKTALITYSLIGFVVAFLYAFLATKKWKQS